MRVPLDTNVVLDVLLKRDPWAAEASVIWKAMDDGHLVGHVTATTLTDIFYVTRRLTDLETARETLRTCLDAFEICPVDRRVLGHANSLAGMDFEDNLQIACAEADALDAIVTRDVDGFTSSSVDIYTPASLVKLLGLDRPESTKGNLSASWR